MYLFIFIIGFLFINKFSLYYDKKEEKRNNELDYLIFQLNNNILNIWGKNELIILNSNNYLKYLDNNKTRIYINFDLNKIIIETINKNPNIYLKNCINNLLLTNNLNEISIFNFKISLNNKNKMSFLYRKILDNYGYPITSKKDAINYINFILKNKINVRYSGNNKIYSIILYLNENNNYFKCNYNNYIKYIKESSKKYNIDYLLILSIIKVESNFNTFAISESGAIGLMQIIQERSGIDVFKIQGKNGFPSKKYLFNPKNNIDVGTAYLYIIQNNYLNKINNPISLRYLTISSYNGGIKNTLNIFSTNYNNAINIINNMTPNSIYNIISNNHYSEEIRNYIIKVNKSYNYYNKLKNINKIK